MYGVSDFSIHEYETMAKSMAAMVLLADDPADLVLILAHISLSIVLIIFKSTPP